MNKKKTNMIEKVFNLTKIVGSHYTGAFAAQSAYFFVLSLIPIIILLLAMVRFTPLTKTYVVNAVVSVFPVSVESFIRMLVGQVYQRSDSIIPITIIVAMWSAGKGVLSMTYGLNLVYDNIETRNYFYLRIRASLYTVLFLIAIVLSLLLSVFGDRISFMLNSHAPFLKNITELIIQTRTLITLIVLTFFWDIVYKYLPNRKDTGQTTLKKQLPGALFTACGWLIISFIFSVYLDIFKGFSTMYGSLTTLILIMLWLYMCMYVILLGGELNAMLERYCAAGHSTSFLSDEDCFQEDNEKTDLNNKKIYARINKGFENLKDKSKDRVQ